MAERVLGFAEALGTVLAEAGRLATPADVERVGLLDAVGRVLAEPVRAERDQPPFHRATRDGFALRAADAGAALRVLGQVRAGEAWSGAPVGAGEAVEIMTGAPLPQGADAVVMVEHSAVENNMLWVDASRSLKPGENVVAQGAEARAGAGLLPAGRVIGAAEVAVAASCGRAELPVFARPKAGIVATGDELVELAPSHPTHDGETVMNGAPGFACQTDRPQVLRLPRRPQDDEIIARLAAGCALRTGAGASTGMRAGAHLRRPAWRSAPA